MRCFLPFLPSSPPLPLSRLQDAPLLPLLARMCNSQACDALLLSLKAPTAPSLAALLPHMDPPLEVSRPGWGAARRSTARHGTAQSHCGELAACAAPQMTGCVVC